MKLTEKNRKYLDIALASAAVLVLIVLVGVLFDHYYEFNDDILMKDIMSGAYTGTPSGHNIQTLWPLGALIALFYRIVPGVAWYGLFLCACHYVCVILLTYRAIRISPRKRGVAIAIAVSFLFTTNLLLPHLVMAQYTITVSVVAATAAFIFYTIPYDLNEKQFVKQAAPAIFLVILAFNIRSEMLLLLLPYIAITGLARWNRESSMFGKDTVKRYMIVILAMALGMVVSFGMDKIAYGSSEWKAFLEEFNSRTQLYDYQFTPSYAGNEDFYKSIGLTEADVDLLTNYDYAIDDKINADIIGRVADYAASTRQETLRSKLFVAGKEYIYRVIHFVDGAYAIVTLFLYIMLIWAIMARKESTLRHKIYIIVLRIGGLVVMRSVSWIYIVMGHRAPVRITHSLYIMEIVILLSMVMVEFTSKLRERGYLQMITSIMLIGGGIIMLPSNYMSVKDSIAAQEKINQYGNAIDEYCSSHPKNFYFEDVYSTIINGETFNEKMFVDVDNSIKNYDLIGGWASNSPLYVDKLAMYGITDVDRDILEKKNVYIICSDEYHMDWVSNYYADQGIEVYIECTDSIADSYGVYKIWEVK